MTRYSSATSASNPTDRSARSIFAGRGSWRSNGQWVALGLILAFVATRGLLGALINPPFNGPDERGHFLEVATSLQVDVSDEERASQHQPRPYYFAAALAIRLLGIPVGPEHLDWQALFPLRLASVLLGTLTTAATYVTARYALRGDPAAAPTALAAALVAGLAPSHQFTMASAANDPLAIALAAASTAAAVATVAHGWTRNRALVLVGAALAAVATKSTGWGAVIVAGVLVVAALRRRRPAAQQDGTAGAADGTGQRIPGLRWSISDRWLVGAGAVGVLSGLAGLLLVVRLAPESFFVIHQLPFLLPAAWRLPVNYLLLPGGLSETFRTFWVQPDYAAPALSAATIGTALLVLAAVAGGLRMALARGGRSLRRAPALVLIGSVLIQLLLIGYRYSLGVEKEILLGGAAQAKFMLPALPAIAILLVVGWAGLLPDGQRRRLPVLVLVVMLAVDAATLLPFLWQHYQWLELRPV
ncbi:MAG: hypothetical protein OXU67_01805 [Chloroflexota bacterium]|nr:hypothetical protein [Chloroflexota bacterium]